MGPRKRMAFWLWALGGCAFVCSAVLSWEIRDGLTPEGYVSGGSLALRRFWSGFLPGSLRWYVPPLVLGICLYPWREKGWKRAAITLALFVALLCAFGSAVHAFSSEYGHTYEFGSYSAYAAHARYVFYQLLLPVLWPLALASACGLCLSRNVSPWVSGRRWLALALPLLAVTCFLYFLWPTPWEFRSTIPDTLCWRKNRITGSVDAFNPGTGLWERAKHPEMYGSGF